MARAAVPAYLAAANLTDTTPEMRFGLLFPWWNGQWAKDTEETKNLWDSVTRLNPGDLARMQALAERQMALYQRAPADTCLRMEGVAIAPFTTGLGNEHPTENGFAFLAPYGLPYLAGSGVKGVLRRAAEELAVDAPGCYWENDSSWTQAAITALFGSDDEKQPCRGALSFWDVIPQFAEPGGASGRLSVDIMTPHQGEYYQGKSSPHDCGQPNPIKFLTVPAGAHFSFTVTCEAKLLQRRAPQLMQDERWQSLLAAAFEHAFNWCGFGAKTAAGYGAIQRDESAEARLQEQRLLTAKQAAEELRKSTMSPVEIEIDAIVTGSPDEPGALLFNQANAGKWSDEADLATVAEAIKGCWQAANKWIPGFSGSNKQKMQQRDKCLKVQGWLGE